MELYQYSNNSTTAECSSYNSTMYTAVAAVRGFSGGISSLASFSVVLLIVMFRKYHFFVQRLILYLSLASLVNGLSEVLQAAYQHPTTRLERDYCTITAFLNQISDWSVYLSTLTITIHLYVKAVHNRKIKQEAVCLILIFVFPLSFNWVPFINNTYGEAGPWCWIRLYNEDCTKDKFGRMMRIILWFIPSNAVLISIIALYTIMIIVLRHEKHKYKGHYDPQREMDWKMKIREVRILILYPVMLLLTETPAIVNRSIELLTNKDDIPALWFFQAFFSPLQGGLVCLAYALDPDTRARLRSCSWHSLPNYINVNDEVSEYPAKKGRSDSISEEEKKSSLMHFKPRENTGLLTDDSLTTSFKTFPQDNSLS